MLYQFRHSLLSATIAALPFTALAQPVTGPYISVGAGYNITSDSAKDYTYHPGINISYGPYPVTFKDGYALSGAVGYGFGAGKLGGFRIELEGSYRSNPLNTLSTSNGLFTFSGNNQRTSVLVNALYDFNLGLPVYPYLGAGVGVAMTNWSNVPTTNNHTTIGTTVTDLVAKETTNDSVATLAVQVTAGLAMPVAAVPGLSLTLDYRFFALPTQRTFNDQATLTCGGTVCLGFPNLVAPGGSRYGPENNHSIMIGLRYAFNGP